MATRRVTDCCVRRWPSGPSSWGAASLLARYGGEEFAVLLPGLTLPEAQARIQDLRALTPHGQTFSAGVSMWDSLTEPAHVVACADQALYEAKRTGRDRVLATGASPSTRPCRRRCRPSASCCSRSSRSPPAGSSGTRRWRASMERPTTPGGSSAWHTSTDTGTSSRPRPSSPPSPSPTGLTVRPSTSTPPHAPSPRPGSGCGCPSVSTPWWWSSPRTPSTSTPPRSRTPSRGFAPGVRPSLWTTSAPVSASSTGWPRCAPTSSRRTVRSSTAAPASLARAPYCAGW